MTANGFVQIALYCVVVTLLVKPFGFYMTRVFNGERTFLSPILRPVERIIYSLSRVNEREEQSWVGYGLAMLTFSLAGFLALYALQRLQAVLPFNPQHLDPVGPDLAFNTSVSFVTNTNWQSYTPETTMSYLTQMAGLTMHNFVSAATGIALAIALIRGFARRSVQTIGNFWVDMTRTVLYVLLPISIVVGLFFVWQGMPQNLDAYTEVTTLEGGKQLIAQGQVASQEVIKMMGTNGGGFFNANSAHPYENPNALTNFVQIVLIFSIGAALTNVFGRMVGKERQGWAIFAVMGILFLAGTFTVYAVESGGNPAFASLPIDATPGALQPGGNMEGKEVRFGIANSSLFTTVTTDASCGAVNTMHDSLLPLARHGADGQHHARRDHLRRRRLGPLWHAALRDRRGLCRWPDGRPHPGISRQEDRGERGQDGDARHSHPALVDPRLHGSRSGRHPRPRRDGQFRPARLQRSALCLCIGDGQQWQRLRGAFRQHAFL